MARVSMPEVTPAIGGGLGGATVFAYLFTGEPDWRVRLACVAASTVVLCVSAFVEHGIRRERNVTARVQINADSRAKGAAE